MRFTELTLAGPLQQGIDEAGFHTCTEVQERVFQHTLSGRDVCVQSQTGTGKTAAFLITIFQLFQTEGPNKRALVVAPTRELAVQIEREAKVLGNHLPYMIGSIYGGVSYGPQEKLLSEGAQIIVGTPGRLLDFNQSKKLDLRQMDILVIDEADRLFDMGFYPDIRKMMSRARPREERMTMLFSATLSTRVRNLAWQFMNDPAEIEIRPESIVVEEVAQQLYHVSQDDKMRLLLGVLHSEQPETALVFCNTKRSVELVAKRLERNGHRCEFIIGDLPQKKRLRIIDQIKNGELEFLVATDVAARGLHINELDMVINFDLPEDPESYVHRIGRTARAGKSGKAVSFACERYVYSLEAIEELIGGKIPSAVPEPALLRDDATEGEYIPLSRPHTQGGPRSRSSSGSRSTHGSRRPGRAPAGRPSGGRQRHRPAPEGERSHARATHEPAARPVSHKRTPPRGDGHTRTQRPGTEPAADAPTRHDRLDDRLEYYRKKYGEDFAVTGSSSGTSGAAAQDSSAAHERPAPEKEEPQRSGILKRLFGRKK